MKSFDAKMDAEALKNSISPKKDENSIIQLVTNRTNSQLQQIKESYTTLYNSDLIKDLKKALSGHFEDVVVGLFCTPIDYDCFHLRKAIKGLGTDENALIEIICTRPPDTIEKIKKRYGEMYPGRNLIKDVEGDTSGNFRKILKSLLNANRHPDAYPNLEECKNCAKRLYEAGEKILGTNEDVFTQIFTEKSPSEFICIAQLYHKLTKHTLLQAVQNEFSFDSKKCLIAIIYAILSPSEYFAKLIYKAIKGLGTDDTTLIRVMVSRHEIDMPQIKQYYKQNYKKDMIEDIKNDTSGTYRQILVELASH
jgi:hypothetical protein